MTSDGLPRAFIIASKFLFLACLPFLALGYGSKVIEVFSGISGSARCISFGLGAIVFLPVWWLSNRYLQKPWQFICTLEHEVTHAIIGLPFLLVPTRMWVTASRGGHVKQRWIGPVWLVPLYGLGSLLSTLAPYFFPTPSYLLIALGFTLVQPETHWFLMSLGFFTTFHLISSWAETRYVQPDIQEAGIVFSTLFLPVANLICVGGILASVVGGSKGFAVFWVEGFYESLTHFLAFSDSARSLRF